VTDFSTSWPIARSRTLAMKSFTTGKATSASSSANRTSRSASNTSFSFSAPRPRNRSKTAPNLLDSESNMHHTPTQNTPLREHSRGGGNCEGGV